MPIRSALERLSLLATAMRIGCTSVDDVDQAESDVVAGRAETRYLAVGYLLKEGQLPSARRARSHPTPSSRPPTASTSWWATPSRSAWDRSTRQTATPSSAPSPTQEGTLPIASHWVFSSGYTTSPSYASARRSKASHRSRRGRPSRGQLYGALRRLWAHDARRHHRYRRLHGGTKVGHGVRRQRGRRDDRRPWEQQRTVWGR